MDTPTKDTTASDSTIKDIAKKFLDDEKLPLTEALAFGALGLSKSVGDIAEIAYGVRFSEHPYDSQRKNDMAEFLGNALFYWHLLAIISGFAGQEIVKSWVHLWRAKNRIKEEEDMQVSIKQLLQHLKGNKLKDLSINNKEQEHTKSKQI